MRIRFTMALVAAAMVFAALLPASTLAQQASEAPAMAPSPPPFMPAPAFSTSGFALVVYAGSPSTSALQAAASAAGASGVWVQDSKGAYQLLPAGPAAPAFLTGAFQAAIPTLQAQMAVTLVRLTPQPVTTITTDHEGATITMRVGDVVTLMLGDSYNWSVGEFDTKVLRSVPTFAALPKGTQGMYSAVAPGSTDLTAGGGPNCPALTPCPAIYRLFRVHILVTQ